MRDAFDAILKSLSLTLTPTGPPPAHGGDWFQVLAVFKTHGFARILVSFDDDEALLLVHFAGPGLSEVEAATVAGAMQERASGIWRAMLMDGALAVLGRVSNLDALSSPLASCCRFAEQIEEGAEALAVFLPEKQIEASGGTFAGAPAAEESPGLVFEAIGDESVVADDSLSLEVREDSVFAKLAVDDEPSKAWPGVRRTLRGMLDVDVELLESTPNHLCFSVKPADLGGTIMTLAKTVEEVRRVLQTPAVKTPQTPLAPHNRPLKTDLPVRRAEPNVVFSLPNDGPLKPGDFDDARLSEPDSAASLVDIVLRHPGYSDRRVGQVLSILLSVEYHRALQLMGASPLVIAHGVAYSRAETLKRVVESAGGKIQLTDPGRYPAS